ncbi:MAG: mechanosensitive ion channel family protein [Planctomycetota bacterium]|jgi:small-conductance mechanosensitive channel
MRTKLALILLLSPLLAQEPEAESAATVEAQLTKNKEMAEKAAKAAAPVEKSNAEQEKAARSRETVEKQFKDLQERYRSGEDRPDRTEVHRRMRELGELAKEGTLEVERLVKLQEEVGQEQQVFLDETSEWSNELDQLEAEHEDPRWAQVRSERAAILKQWSGALGDRTRAIRSAVTDARKTAEIYLRMRSVHERENLLLQDVNTMTWDSARLAIRDISLLPEWARASVQGTREYFEDPKAYAALTRWAIASLIGLVLVIAGGITLKRYAMRLEAKGESAHQQRVIRVMARFIRRLLHFLLIFFVPYSAAAMLPALPPDVQELLVLLARFFAFAYLIWAIYRELLRPDRPEQALVKLDDRARRRISRAVRIVVLACLVLRPLQIGLEAFDYENVGAIDLLEAVFFLLFTYLLTGVIFRKAVFRQLLPQQDVPWARLVRAVGGVLRPFLMLLMPTLFFLHVARFELLADTVTRYSMALLGSIIASALLYQVAKAIALPWMHKIHGPEGERSSQGQAMTAALLFALHVAVFLFGVWMLAWLAGSTIDELRFTLEAPLPFQGGDSPATWWGLFAAVALFCFFFFGTPHAKQLLNVQVLERTNLDSSTRYTIATLFGYFVLAVGSVIAIRMVFNLSDLGTIVAALSVGIGFGLQEIVSNFISGIILLFERPIRVGDMIEVGPNRGLVGQINIRKTTVKTADNVFIHVPNRDLMSQTVVNYGYSDPKLRLRIPVGVSYSSDPEQVRDILIKVAEGIDGALTHPAPDVQFMAMADSSLNFDLLVWVQRPDQRLAVLSAINFAVFKALGEAGIEIPFPQRDLHIRSQPAPEPRPEPGEDRED